MVGSLSQRRFFLLALALWMLPCEARADSPPPRALPLIGYVHDVWTTRDGLPQNSVADIVQTPDGYLWVSTLGGVARFDGLRFTTYSKASDSGLPFDALTKMTVDRSGTLWIGSHGGGLLRRHDDEFVALTQTDGLSSNVIRAVVGDRSGVIWTGTHGGGACRLDAQEVTCLGAQDGLASDTVWSIYEDASGALWFGTDGGLSVLRPGQRAFKSYTVADGLANNRIRALTGTPDGTVWIGTEGGLVRFRGGVFTTFRKRDGLSVDAVRSLLVDREQRLWIGTYGGGLVRFAEGRFETFSAAQGLVGDVVIALFEDNEGSIWIGTRGGGLNRLRPSPFITYNTERGLLRDMAWSVTQTHDGAMWVATQGGGISRLEDGVFRSFTTADGLAHNMVWSLYEDRKHNLWIGTWGGGLGRLTEGRFRSYGPQDGLHADAIRTVYEDSHGILWLGTDGNGLIRFEDGTFSALTTDDGLAGNEVQAVLEDKKGDLWIGTHNGLNRIRDGRIETFTKAHGLGSDLITALHEDADSGDLWIGTRAGGLNRYRDGAFFAFTPELGLADDVVFQILDDQLGYLWMSSNRGVYRVSKADLEAVAAGKPSTLHPDAFGDADGMVSSECNGWSQPAGWRSRDGRLWFPTTSGVVTVDPRATAPELPPPPVVLEGVLVDGEPVRLTKNIALPPGRGELTIRFAVLSFLRPERIQVRYRLEGFDTNWVVADSRRTAYYTNLPPGQYQFRVVASNSNGVWNQTGTSMEFVLAPHFYQTRFFYVLCGLLAIGLAVGVHGLRVAHLERQRQRLEGQVEQRTAELALSNQRVLKSLEKLRKSQNQLVIMSRRAGMAEVATGVLHNVGNALTSVNVTASLMHERVRHSRLSSLGKLIELLNEHRDNFARFLTEDERGRRIPKFLAELNSRLKHEHDQALEGFGSLLLSLGHVVQIVGMQQSHARIIEVKERTVMAELIGDVLRLEAAEMEPAGIAVKREEEPLAAILVDRHKLVLILSTLLSNAREAVMAKADSGTDGRWVTVHTRKNAGRLSIDVADGGVGIAAQDQSRIFSFGFTSKPQGHGFGLHASALAAQEAGWTLSCSSEGPGKGACFTLELPLELAES